MHKVVVERPRWNPGPGKHGRRANLPDELLPKFEGIRRPHSHRKAFTDLLSPLERWLHSQIGLPWNDVYSEACAVIKPDSVIRAHIKTHLLEFVERHTFMRDGKICVVVPYSGDGVMPVSEIRYGRSGFFVHPETHLLCEIPRKSRRRRPDVYSERRALTQRWLSETFLLRRLNGCWFECHVVGFSRQYTKDDSPWRFDVAEKKMICRANANDIYGRRVYCISKRQLSRQELRKFGIANNNYLGAQSSALPQCGLKTAFHFTAGWRCGLLKL
jgi:hypothetical protein